MINGPYEEIVRLSTVTARGILWPVSPCGCGASMCSDYTMTQSYFIVALKLRSINNTLILHRSLNRERVWEQGIK